MVNDSNSSRDFAKSFVGLMGLLFLFSCTFRTGERSLTGGHDPFRWEPARVILNQNKKFNIRLARIGDELFISSRDVARLYKFRRHWYRVSQRLSFEALDRQLEFWVGTSSVSLNGTIESLSHSPFLYRKDVYVPLSFLTGPKFSDFHAYHTSWISQSSYLVANLRPSVSSPRLYSYPDRTRVVFELAPWIEYRVWDQREGLLILSFPGGMVVSQESLEVEDGVIQKVLVRPNKRSVLVEFRLSADAAKPDIKLNASPRELVVEVFRKEENIDVRRQASKEDDDQKTYMAEKRKFPSWFSSGHGVQSPLELIVVDPGHGGHDSGAVGPNGTLEKNINLRFAKELAALLKREGRFKVLLTRKKDKFVPLAERTDFANKKKASLFISIHANASLSSKGHGFEVYFLSEKASDPHAAEVARRENAVVEMEGKPTEKRKILENLLWSLARNQFMNESSELSGLISRRIIKRVDIANRGVKQAGFYVLRGAQMPAILIETAFISNPEEEIRLNQKRFRSQVVDAIYSGVLDYERLKIGTSTAKAKKG